MTVLTQNQATPPSTAPSVDRERLDDLVESALARLDLVAKVRLLSGAADFELAAAAEVGLAPVRVSDGPTGVRGQEYTGGSVRALLPNATLLAQQWSTSAMVEVGGVLAEEAEAERTHVVLGPTINLHRSPLGGRLFECLSEDPLLTGHLAAGYVQGLQRRGIGASVKHFLANESETERFTVDSVIDAATLREVYLLPFEIAVSEANPWSVMAAYNKVNGVSSTEQADLINGVLKQEWGYDGVVVSDWHAATTTCDTALAGLDLVMPANGSPWGEALVEAVQAGQLGAAGEEVIDEHLRRVLRLAARVGALGEKREWSATSLAPASGARRDQLRRLAAAGMSVLVNRDRRSGSLSAGTATAPIPQATQTTQMTLPLSAESMGRIALIGRHALETICQGGGSAVVRAPHQVSIAEGLTAALGQDRVEVVDGVEVRQHFLSAHPSALADPETGLPGIRVTALDATGTVTESRHVDVAEVAATPQNWLAGAHTIELAGSVVLDSPTRLRLGVRGHGSWQVSVHSGSTSDRDGGVAPAPVHAETLTVAPYPGPGGGVFRPRSHVTELDVQPGDVLTAKTPGQDIVRILGLVVTAAQRSTDAALESAIQAASRAETAVVVVGFTNEQETEGKDKKTLALPGDQDELVRAVAATGTPTVVVINAATPVLMPWLDEVDAVLQIGLPGQEGGHAVADALLGITEPAGRLVTTYPAVDGAGPAWSTTPVDGRLVYSEGTSVGHRGWADAGETPLFWFGHGLGYTTWEYDSLDIARGPLLGGEALSSATVAVTNTGTRLSREVVQVYLRPDRPDQPVRLVGWAGVDLAPGERADVTVRCDLRAQRTWNTELRTWEALGCGEVVIARGLGDVRATCTL